jgi:transposase
MEAAQKRLDENPQAMRVRRETVEHPFGTLKMRMGATHFLMKRLPKVAPKWRSPCSPTTSRAC